MGSVAGAADHEDDISRLLLGLDVPRRVGHLHTAVTSASQYLASCTLAVPMDPDAPQMRIFCPIWRPAGLTKFRARIAPSQTAAA